MVMALLFQHFRYHKYIGSIVDNSAVFIALFPKYNLINSAVLSSFKDLYICIYLSIKYVSLLASVLLKLSCLSHSYLIHIK